MSQRHEHAKSEQGADPHALRSSVQDPAAALARQRATLLRFVRLTFLVLFATIVLLYVFSPGDSPGKQQWFLQRSESGLEVNASNWPVTIIVCFVAAFIVFLIDRLTPRKKIGTLFSVFFGLLGAMLATAALGFVIDLVVNSWMDNAKAAETIKPLVTLIKVLLGISLAYLGVTTVLQTQDDFRLVIPYVEFAKQIRGAKPMLLDTSALIDARIVDIAATNLIQSSIVIPRFVIAELQQLADSGDAMKRARGRRGLDVIQRLQRSPGLDITVEESSTVGKGVDQNLVELARRISGMIVTTDVALARIAAIHQVPVLNINDLANAVKPNVLPGESITIKLIRPGEQPGQAVGYLPDGTMVVAEDGEHDIGRQVSLTVTSALQTSAGRLIFGRVGGPSPAHQPPRALEPLKRDDKPDDKDASGLAVELPADSGSHDAISDSGAPIDPSRPRSPFPPKPPRSLRGNSPRNPRR